MSKYIIRDDEVLEWIKILEKTKDDLENMNAKKWI